jgi:tetratricopeptide (TPR) repeat protein
MGAHVPLPDLAIVLYFLREGQGIGQAELGELAGVSPNLLNDYEKGRKTLLRERLEFLISFLNLPPETIDDTLATLHANRAAARPPQGGAGPISRARRQVEAVAAQASGMMRDFAREVLSLLTVEGEALVARQQAEGRFARLMRRSPEERLALVERSGKFRGWALCERTAAESIAVAPESPAKALELARLAVRMAELCGEEPALRRRLEGYAGVHLANALRVVQDVRQAGETFERAKKLWVDGAPGDPGLLSEAVVLALEADLRRDQRRFAEALERIGDALAADRAAELRGKLLLSKAQILEALGDTAGSTAALEEAVPWIDLEREPRTALGVRFQFLVNLCREGRAAEAEPRLRQTRTLAERSGKKTDLDKMVWLESKVHAGVGRYGEAEDGFRQVQRAFQAQALPYDYALVSLDLALLLLQQGRTAEVRALAGEMVWIFRAEGIGREAQAALRIYCEAARRETATVELTRRIIEFLHRAQHDPGLRFEEGGAEGH